jgi:cyclic-di-AMP phosphodiesterase PgpH
MNDRTSDLLNYSELKFSREQGFFDKSLAIRFLIGLLFAMSLFALLHFRETRVDVLELGTIAPNYIVSQVDIDYPDEEATIVLKQQAVRDIGKIYQIAKNDIYQRRLEFENFLLYNQEWRKSSEENSLEDLYKSVDKLEKALFQMRFSDPRTLQMMKDVNLSSEGYMIYTPTDLTQSIALPSQVWDSIRESVFSVNPHSVVADFTMDFFQSKNWQIQEDAKAERTLVKKVQALIPEKQSHLNAGGRIIDEGEKVLSRHIAMLQSMKKVLNEKRNLWHPLTLLGTLIMTLLLTLICTAYFRMNYPRVLLSNRKLFLLVSIVILTFMMSKAIEFIILNSKHNLIEIIRYPIVVPFAAILLCSLMNTGIASFTSAFLTIILTMALAFDRPGFMIINLVAALITILTTRSLRRRKEIFVVCAKAWLGCLAVILSLNFYHGFLWSPNLFYDILSAALFMLFTAIVVVGLLPLLESVFRVMTDVTLMEYMDPNNDLLRRLTIEAPGTYQHSVVVGNLTEAAASAIGANALFCRVATLYHDVGKMLNPQFFTENQQPGVDIHQLLTPKESAQVIMAHVSDGVALGRKAGLPEQFIDIIKEHHGTTLVYYFYRKELERVGGDHSLVDEKDFRYSGPKPRSKESAIIMIADSLEAASRSLDQISEDKLMELANRLIRDKADDGQFDNCLLTFEELAVVKATLVKTLVAFAHARIKYPTREQKSDKQGTPPCFEA